MVVAANAELPSEGPFARMARLKAEAEAKQADDSKQAPQPAQPAQPAQVNLTASAGPAAVAASSPTLSVVVDKLEFSYPGLGELPHAP